MPTPSLRFPSSEAGFVLIPVLLFTTLLFLANMMTLSVNGTDLRTTRNRHSGIETLWIARAGTSTAKEGNGEQNPSPARIAAVGQILGDAR